MPYYHKLYAAKLYTSVLKKCSLVVKKSIFVILMIIVCNTNKKSVNQRLFLPGEYSAARFLSVTGGTFALTQ